MAPITRQSAAAQTPDNHTAYFNFEDWLDETNTVYRSGLLDVVEWNDTLSDYEPMAFCHLESLIPFTDSQNMPVLHAYEGALGVFLALKHLNTGDGSIIEDIAGLNEWCPIKFPTELFFNTRYNRRLSFAHIDRQTSLRSPRTLPIPADASLDEETSAEVDSYFNDIFFSHVKPSAFIGGFSSSITAITAYLANLRNFPQISGQSSSSELDNTRDFPFLARTIPNEEYAARNALIWWVKDLKLRYIAVIHTGDSHGNAWARSLRMFARELEEIEGLRLEIMYITLDEDGDNIPEALSTLKASEYRYVFAVLSFRHLHDELMEAAYHAGLAGNPRKEYNWFFADGFRSVLTAEDARSFPQGSPLHLAYRGVGFIKPARSGPELGDGLDQYEIFSQGLSDIKNSPNEIEYLTKILPVNNLTGALPFLEDREYLVYDTASFLYEATVLMGLSVCRAANEDLFVLGDEWYRHMLNTSFDGLTGPVVLNQTTGTRLSNSTAFSIVNYVDEEMDGIATGDIKLVAFSPVVTHYHPAGNYDLDMSTESNWIELNNYTWSSGTSELPPDIPDDPDHELFISTGVQAFSLALYSILVLMVLGFVGWTYFYRENRVVKASQPFFLYLLCGGSFLIACTILTLTMDHEHASIHGNTIACNASMWMASFGLGIVFSALFAKTYRINQIMNSAKKFRRIRITVKQTLVPVAVVFLLNMIVLSIMTARDPVQYEIDILAFDSFGRPVASYGFCDYRGAEGYLIALAVINIGMLLFALYQCWHARKLSTEFAESKYIGYALAGSLIACFVGIPVLILATESPDATAFVSSALVFLIVSMILCMLFVPKMRFQWQLLHQKEDLTKITGLETGKVTVAPADAFAHVTEMLDDATDAQSRPSADGSDRESFGEKILTTKSPEELSKEVALLRFTVVEAQKYIREQGETMAKMQTLLRENGIKYEPVPATVDANRISDIASQIDPLSTPFLMSNELPRKSHEMKNDGASDNDQGEKTSDEENSE